MGLYNRCRPPTPGGSRCAKRTGLCSGEVNQSIKFICDKKEHNATQKTKQNKVPTITGLLVVDRADDELFEKVLGIRQSISYYVLRNILPNKTVPSWDLGRTAIHESLS